MIITITHKLLNPPYWNHPLWTPEARGLGPTRHPAAARSRFRRRLFKLLDACQTGLDKLGSSKMPVNRSQIKSNVHVNTVWYSLIHVMADLWAFCWNPVYPTLFANLWSSCRRHHHETKRTARDKAFRCTTSDVMIVCMTNCHIIIRSVFIISNRKFSNWASQILKTNMLLMCPYCLKFQLARI